MSVWQMKIINSQGEKCIFKKKLEKFLVFIVWKIRLFLRE
jgi:hypothetical protein